MPSAQAPGVGGPEPVSMLGAPQDSGGTSATTSEAASRPASPLHPHPMRGTSPGPQSTASPDSATWHAPTTSGSLLCLCTPQPPPALSSLLEGKGNLGSRFGLRCSVMPQSMLHSIIPQNPWTFKVPIHRSPGCTCSERKGSSGGLPKMLEQVRSSPTSAQRCTVGSVSPLPAGGSSLTPAS